MQGCEMPKQHLLGANKEEGIKGNGGRYASTGSLPKINSE